MNCHRKRQTICWFVFRFIENRTSVFYSGESVRASGFDTFEILYGVV